MRNLEGNKANAAYTLSSIARTLGHEIFLSGGAAAWVQGSKRPVKDLDFRIRLPFNWLSPAGVRLMRDFTARMMLRDPHAKGFVVNDTATGHTIRGKFLKCEVSISNTTLPLYGEFSTSGEYPRTLNTISLDDNIFDKMLSLMFRHVLEKAKTDMYDLCKLLTLSDKHPIYYVRHFFVRRGAAYAFNSKPMQIQRRHTDLQGTVIAPLERNTIKKLADDPESLMLEEFHLKLETLNIEYKIPKTAEDLEATMLEEFSFNPEGIITDCTPPKSKRMAWKALRVATERAVHFKSMRISLARDIPATGVVRSRNFTDTIPGVVAGRTRHGNWEV